MPHRRTDLAIGVDYNTDIAAVMQILSKTVSSVAGVLPHPEPEVDAVGFGDSSIDLMVRYWTLPQKVKVRQTRTRAIVAIKQEKRSRWYFHSLSTSRIPLQPPSGK